MSIGLEAAIRRHVSHWPTAGIRFERIAAELRLAFDACDVVGGARHAAELIAEEVVTNILRHGAASSIVVSLDRSTPGEALVLTFEDDGPAFDPLAQALPAPLTSLENAPLGGLGLALVRKASDRLEYERIADHTNRLTVTIAGR